MTLVSSTLNQEQDNNLGSHEYSAKDQAFSAFPWYAWRNVKFYDPNQNNGLAV